MARQQFEDQFRNKLEQRAIKPSGGSWEQLSGRLDSARKKTIPLFWWAGIAATLVGGFLIYSLVFNFNSNVETPVIVDTPSEQTKNEILREPRKIVPVVSEEMVTEKISEKTKNPSEKNNISSPVNKTEAPVVVSAKQEIVPENSKAFLAEVTDTVEDTRIKSRLEEAIAAVSSTADHQDATDAEIEALLYEAAVEIGREEKRETATGSIDAKNLLFDVELELEQSFREKVFDLLKDGYSKARSAVANRN